MPRTKRNSRLARSIQSISDSESNASETLSNSDHENGQEIETPQTEVKAVGLTDENVSQARKKLLGLIDRLVAVGVQCDIDLPQIAVIGSQSAGKSSLIESISGIRLPRASGTCTRCPIELRLQKYNGPWRCTVSLRFTVDNDGHPINEPKTIKFGQSINRIEEVEERIRRAQIAILNPSMSFNDPKRYLSSTFGENPATEIAFSYNTVVVLVEGVNMTDLTFCDLPGLIAGVGRSGRQGDVETVRNMVLSYTRKPSCLILLTVACESDFQTQSAYDLAMDCDPEGTRTIGVLTKPDRIPAGDEERWLRLVRNEATDESLELGWFCVRQPDAAQLKAKMTWEQARQQEEQYFVLSEHWRSLPHEARQRLGVAKLVERLSDTLSDLIAKRLPGLQDELQKLLQVTQSSLTSLPPLSSKPAYEMLHLISTFTREVERQVTGTIDRDGIIQQIRPKQKALRRSIRAMAPDFRPYSRDEPKQDMPPFHFLAMEEDLNEELADRASGSGEDTLYIDEVDDRAETSRSRELPGHTHFGVTKAYTQDFVMKWKNPSQAYFGEVQKIIMSRAMSLVKRHFRRFEHGGLLSAVQMAVQDHIKRRREETQFKLDWLLRIEEYPMTSNEFLLSTYKTKFLEYYRDWRLRKDNKTFMDSVAEALPPAAGAAASSLAPGTMKPVVAKVVEELVSLGLNVTPSELQKVVHEPMDRALNIMADVRAYFQVAYKRYIDNVYLVIDYDFVLGLARDLESVLHQTIANVGQEDSNDRCQKLLEDAPSVCAKREELRGRLERLEAAKAELAVV